MTIKEILDGKVGQKAGGGFELSIKTFKKLWETKEGWFQQVILMDKTGEIPADVFLGKPKVPNTRPDLGGRGKLLRIMSCELQEAEYLGKDRKKLLITEFTTQAQTFDEYDAAISLEQLKWNKEIRGKIRHGLTCSHVKASSEAVFGVDTLAMKKINELVDFIMTGEVK